MSQNHTWPAPHGRVYLLGGAAAAVVIVAGLARFPPLEGTPAFSSGFPLSRRGVHSCLRPG